MNDDVMYVISLSCIKRQYWSNIIVRSFRNSLKRGNRWWYSKVYNGIFNTKRLRMVETTNYPKSRKNEAKIQNVHILSDCECKKQL